jgi:2-aminoethylphosphonate-pyruvate transaminase
VAFCSLNANKFLESVPGLSFVLARRDVLETLDKSSRGFYLDLYSQWESLKRSGKTPFTTQVVHATRQAVIRLVEEGYDQRVERYRRLRERLLDGVIRLGLSPVPIPSDKVSNVHILVRQPPQLSYAELHDALRTRVIVIYSDAATIERGLVYFATMGAIEEADVDDFLVALHDVLDGHGALSEDGALDTSAAK